MVQAGQLEPPVFEACLRLVPLPQIWHPRIAVRTFPHERLQHIQTFEPGREALAAVDRVVATGPEHVFDNPYCSVKL